MKNKKQIYFVIGPTSSGKTALSVELAKKIEGEQAIRCEIICCDSRQIYIDLDIGSGKVTEAEMQGVPHHMLSVVKPGEKFTVVDYVNMATKIIQDIFSRGNIPIVSGGTGFYVDALLYKYNLPDVPANPELRKELQEKSVNELWKTLSLALSQGDGTSALKSDVSSKELRNNKNRVIRYIEIIKTLGHLPKLEKEKRFDESEYDVRIIQTNIDRKSLKERIYKRTIQRLEDGMLEEFKNIILKYNLSHKYVVAMGYEFRLMWDLLNNKIDKKTFLEEFVRQEYQYAKRQETWFRRYDCEKIKTLSMRA